jgi:hypothetical protein
MFPTTLRLRRGDGKRDILKAIVAGVGHLLVSIAGEHPFF